VWSTPRYGEPLRAQLAKRVIAAIWSTGKPVLAAVDGPAIGAGAALAAACDRVIAGRGAKFAFTFINIGLCGDMGTFVSLPARVGAARARQLLMFATALDATEALQIGLAMMWSTRATPWIRPTMTRSASRADQRPRCGPLRRCSPIRVRCIPSRSSIAKPTTRRSFLTPTTSPRGSRPYARSANPCSRRPVTDS
jgi:hypothetical protein